MKRKSKRDKKGRIRYDYAGVSPSEFMGAMRTGKYQGRKVSKRGSFIVPSTGNFTAYALALKRKKKDRFL
tara:strand:- start:4015 stop:4224 length:210 start_codon:yes stop_codon:yes gene_type:complete